MTLFFFFSFSLILFNIYTLNCLNDKENNNLINESINHINIKLNDEIFEKKFFFESYKYHKNSIFWNIPRNNNNTSTFLSFKKNKTKANPWPNSKFNDYKANLEDCKPFISVIAFEFDDDNNLYILDEGSSECSVKLYKFNLDESFDNYETYDINLYINESTLFNDLTLDTNNNYVYILYTNLTLSNNQYYSSGIIVIDFNNDNNIQKIPIHIIQDENYSITDNVKNITNYYKKMISISLSCDGESLFISPLNSRKIYSISTEELREEGKNIKINEAYKNDATSSLIVSNLANLYFPGIEEKVIYIAGQIDNDLSRFDYRSMDKIDISKDINDFTFISKISINNGILYLTIKKYKDNMYESDFIEKKINEENNYENSYVYKCIGLAYTYNWTSFIVWIIFGIIIIMIIVFVIVENQQDKDINKKTN